MLASSTWLYGSASARTRRVAAIAMTVALAGLMACLAAPAGASAAGMSRDTAPPVSVSVSALPAGEVEEVLSGIPLKDLSAAQLSEVLSRLPALSALPAGPLREALTRTIEGLAGEGDTLGQLANPPEVLSKLEGQLKKVLTLSELLSLLKGESLSSVLGGALGSLDSSQMLGGLLSSAAKPEQLIAEVLAAASPTQLEALLGTTLKGEPFSASTAGELASHIGTTTEGLAEDLDTSSAQLPSSAMALTAPLANGKTLGVLDTVDGLALGVLQEKTPEGSGGGSGGSGGPGGGSGGSGGAGGSAGGASGTPSTTTILVSLPAQGATALSPGNGTTPARIRIVSRRVRGDAVTIVVQVPAAGTLTLRASGVRAVSRQADRAERVTLRTVLMKAGVASLRKHHHRVKLRLEVSFREVAGPSASTGTTVGFG